MSSVSLIIPIKDGENNLLNRFAEMTRELENLNLAFELIFVDIGSKDHSPQIVQQLAANHPYVKSLRVKNSSRPLCEAIKEGIEIAKYEVIAFPGMFNDITIADLPSYISSLNDGNDLIFHPKNKKFSSLLSVIFYNTLTPRRLRVTWSEINASGWISKTEELKKYLNFPQFDLLLPLYFRLEGRQILEKKPTPNSSEVIKSTESFWLFPQIWKIRSQLRRSNIKFIESP